MIISEINASAHCSVCALAVPSAAHYTVLTENAFQHHSQALRNTPAVYRIIQTHLEDVFIGAAALKMLGMTKVVMHTPPLQHSMRSPPYPYPSPYKGQGTCGTLTVQGKTHSDKLIHIIKLTEASWNI